MKKLLNGGANEISSSFLIPGYRFEPSVLKCPVFTIGWKFDELILASRRQWVAPLSLRQIPFLGFDVLANLKPIQAAYAVYWLGRQSLIDEHLGILQPNGSNTIGPVLIDEMRYFVSI